MKIPKNPLKSGGISLSGELPEAPGTPPSSDRVRFLRRKDLVMSVGEPTQDEGSDIPAFLARIQAGDEDAARELLTRYEAEVRLVVRRQLPRLLRSRFDSLDFLQSVWGSFFRRVRGKHGLFEFEDSPPVAYLEGWGSGRVVKDAREVAAIATALGMIKGCALSPIDSAQLITTIRSEL